MKDHRLTVTLEQYLNRFCRTSVVGDYVDYLSASYPSLNESIILKAAEHVTYATTRAFGRIIHKSPEGLVEIINTIQNLRGIVSGSIKEEVDIIHPSQYRVDKDLVNLFKLYVKKDADCLRAYTSETLEEEGIEAYRELVDEIIRTQIELVTNTVENALPGSVKGLNLITVIDNHPDKFCVIDADKEYIRHLHKKYPLLEKRYVLRVSNKIVEFTLDAIKFSAEMSLGDVETTIKNLRGIVSGYIKNKKDIVPLSADRNQWDVKFLFELYRRKDLQFMRSKVSETLKGDAIIPYATLIAEVIRAQVELVTHSVEEILPILRVPAAKEDSEQPPQPQHHEAKNVKFVLKDKTKERSRQDNRLKSKRASQKEDDPPRNEGEVADHRRKHRSSSKLKTIGK